MRKNRGYSLVELIIVLAIIVVLAVLSLVSLTLITTARAKDASTEFGSEIQVIKKKCMDMTPVKEVWSDYDTLKNNANDLKARQEGARFGIIMYLEDGNYKISEVCCYEDGSSSEYIGDIGTLNETVTFSKRVDVVFKGTYTSFNDATHTQKKDVEVYPGDVNDVDSICIMFDRHGNCTSGYGEYDFNRKNGSTVAKVYISKNGTVEIR